MLGYQPGSADRLPTPQGLGFRVYGALTLTIQCSVNPAADKPGVYIN